jgi:hypothetical protein
MNNLNEIRTIKETNEIINQIKSLEQKLKEVKIGSVRSSEILHKELPELLSKAEIQVKEHLKDTKAICLNSRNEIDFRNITKWDLEVYWKISDCLTELEKMLEVKTAFHDYRLYFSNTRTSNRWFNNNRTKKEVKLVECLEKAGKLALDYYDLDIRIRKVAKRDKENYRAIFQHVWSVKELLNIQPDEEDILETGMDYRYPGFGITYGRAEQLAKGGNE